VCISWTGLLCTDAHRLAISPSGLHIKKIDAGMILACSFTSDDLAGLQPGSTVMNWIGPDLQRITATSGRSEF